MLLMVQEGIMYFNYSDESIAFLSARDEKLADYIQKRGKILRKTEPDVFAALVQSIIGQQISNKAFATVYERFRYVCGEITPQGVLNTDEAALRSCGISQRKAANIYVSAGYFRDREIDAAYFSGKNDEEIIAELVRLPGVGRWTAEMLLLFSLQRQNILSYGDYGIKKGLCLLHGLEKLDKKNFLRYKELYSPHCSVASLYLWEIANTF